MFLYINYTFIVVCAFINYLNHTYATETSALAVRLVVTYAYLCCLIKLVELACCAYFPPHEIGGARLLCVFSTSSN